MWGWLVTFAVSTAFGVAASLLPVLNNEAYVLGTRLTGWGSWVPLALGLGLGNGIGKTVLVQLLRAGRRLPWWPRTTLASADPGGAGAHPARPGRWTSLRRWWSRTTAPLLRLVGTPWAGLPLVALSAATSIPPLYPTTVVVAASRMRLWPFFVACTLGSVARAALLCLIAAGLVG